MEAERNIFGIIDGMPVVHLEGHVSQHFVVGSMRFGYMHSKECTNEEFIKACEARGWQCMMMNNACCIHGKHHQVVIAPKGRVFIDGEPYSIQDQINKQRAEDERIPAERRAVISQETKIPHIFPKEC